MITASGPDGTSFSFPDDTPPDVISSSVRKHYGTDAAPAAPAAPARDVSAIAAAQAVPVAGAYAIPAAAHLRSWMSGGTPEENKAQITSDVANYRQQHPVRAALGDVAAGSLPYLAAGEFAGPAKLLGMTGRLATALPTAAASGGVIGGADAAARGEPVGQGALSGALMGAGGVGLGHAAGVIYDAARGVFRPAAAQRFLPDLVAGEQIPATESQITGNINTAREEERMRKTGVPTAVQADQNANAAMQRAHQNFNDQLNPDPNAPSAPAPHPLEAAQGVSEDLVAQEEQRTAAEVARMSGVRTGTDTLRQGLAGPAAPPMSVADVGDMASQGIADRLATARQGTNAAYQNLRDQQGGFNPRYLLNAGENRIRPALEDPTRVGLPRSESVYVKPDLVPHTFGALQDIDHQVGQLAFTNDVARGNRPITPDDIEEVRKILVQRQQAANQAARAGAPNGWQDARGVRRVMQEFDRHMMDVVTTPGGYSGDAQAYVDAQQAARQSHANMRRVFSRQGAGDKVGTFMENVIGKYPGQEMSPDKIASQIFGTPGGRAPENAVPILNHLRDNVFGPNSPEWGQIKQAAVAHQIDTPPGSEPLPMPKIADRIDRFLGNDRHAGALLSPQERAQLAQHSADLRAAPDETPQPGTIEHTIAELSGRGGRLPSTPAQLLSELMSNRGEHLANYLQQALPDRMPGLKQAIFKHISGAPEGMTAWEHQRMGNQIAKFLNTPAALALFTPEERTVMQGISAAHLQLVPVKGSVNTSNSAFTGEHMLKGLRHQLLRGLGLTHGVHGLAAMEGVNWAADRVAARNQARRAEELFVGHRPTLPPSQLPQRIGATIGQRPLLRDQSQ